MKKFFQAVGVIALCLVIFASVVTIMALKIDAYGGDVGCLFVRCVKIVH